MHNKKHHIVRKTMIVLGSFILGIVGTVIAAATYDASIQTRVSSMMKSIKTNASALAPADASAYYTLVHLNIQSLLKVLVTVDEGLLVEIGSIPELQDDNVLAQIAGNTGVTSSNTGVTTNNTGVTSGNTGSTFTAGKVTINVAGGTSMLCGDPSRNDYTSWSDANWQSARTNVIDKAACNSKGNDGVGYVWNVCNGVITNKKTVNSLVGGETFSCTKTSTTNSTNNATTNNTTTTTTNNTTNTTNSTNNTNTTTSTTNPATTQSYLWSCVVAGPVAVNTSQYSCNSSNAGKVQKINGYDCTCISKTITTGVVKTGATTPPTHPPLTASLYANDVLVSNNSVIERNADGYVVWRWDSSVECVLNGSNVAKTGTKSERYNDDYGSYLCYDGYHNTRKNIEYTLKDKTVSSSANTNSTQWITKSSGYTQCTTVGGGNIAGDSRLSSAKCNIGDVVYQRTNCTQVDVNDKEKYMWTNYECTSTSPNGALLQTQEQVAAQNQAQLATEAAARAKEEARLQALVEARAKEEAARLAQLRLNGGVSFELAKACGNDAAVLENETIRAYADRTGNLCDIRLCLTGRVLSSDRRNCIDSSLIGAIDKEKYHSKNLAVKLSSDKKPIMIGIYDGSGILLTNVNFNVPEIIKGLEKYNVDKSQLSELANQLDAGGIRYKPYEMYLGTGSDAGIDLRDLANGGTGRGTAGTGIDCNTLAQQNTSSGLMKWAICSKGLASWYMTQAEATAAQQIYTGTKVMYISRLPITN